MDEVKNDYINNAILELIPVLGVREFVDQDNLYYLIHTKEIKGCIKSIALSLGLPIEVNLSYVSNDYKQGSTDGFSSTDLVKTNHQGRGEGGITAQVSIPSYLPFYGTQGMVNFPINVRVSKNCTENPASFISIIAHELSHIVLHSMQHKQKENEFYTDLTAMIMGFAGIMRIGRKYIKTTSSTSYGFLSSQTTTHTQTTTYGYLSDNNFDFAFSEIKEILDKRVKAKRILLKRLKKFNAYLKKQNKMSTSFKSCMKYVDENHDRKIIPADGQKIISFHEHGYTDQFDALTKETETTLASYIKFANLPDSFTTANLQTLGRYDEKIKSLNGRLNKLSSSLTMDLSVLKKYVGTMHKLKLMFS